MEEDPDGEWVRYEDIKKAVEAYDGWVERGIWKEDGCNCAEKVDRAEAIWLQLRIANPDSTVNEGDIPMTTWICPAHGYKRL